MRELPHAGHLGRGLVASEHEPLEHGPLDDPPADPNRRPRFGELHRPDRPLHERQEARDHDVVTPERERAEDRKALGRFVVLGQGTLEGQRRALGQGPHVRAADPGRQVVGESMRLVVVARHDDERSPRR